jgi:hypothetical protein
VHRFYARFVGGGVAAARKAPEQRKVMTTSDNVSSMKGNLAAELALYEVLIRALRLLF